MKNVITTLVLSTITLGACQNNERQEKIEAEPQVLVQDEAVIELPNHSDQAFNAALNLFAEKDYKAAALKIDEAMGDLAGEAEKLSDEPKQQFDNSIEALKKTTILLNTKPTAESEAALQKAMNAAETEIAHNYFYLSDSYLIEQPDKSAVYLRKGMEHLKNSKKVTQVKETPTI